MQIVQRGYTNSLPTEVPGSHSVIPASKKGPKSQGRCGGQVQMQSSNAKVLSNRTPHRDLPPTHCLDGWRGHVRRRCQIEVHLLRLAY